MLIGLVGKPSVGKSTFFKAATLAEVEIASYPFTTIKANHGIGYVRVECLDKEFGVKCNPSHGFCVNSQRFVPIEIMDVAGLVKGASEGKGLGNQFLDDLRQADVFIHIVDVSGTTNEKGEETEGYDPSQDIDMLDNELDMWYLGIFKKIWGVFTRGLQNNKQDFSKAVARQFSGLKVKENDVKDVIRKLGYDIKEPAKWSEEQLKNFSHELRVLTKPMIIAANKVDIEDGKDNYYKLKENFLNLNIVPCSADSELALRQAAKFGLIDYIPGDKDLKINKESNSKQKEALEKIKKNVLDIYGNTGVQNILNNVVFDLLGYIAIFPAGANKLEDSKGNILPDCFLLPKGSKALDFAFHIHSDLGENFIKAIDARTKKAVGKDYELKHRDALEIITR